MEPRKHLVAHLARLKRMGIVLIALAFFFSLGVYLLPTDESNYWFSSNNKEGVYVLSAFFCFLGFYCLGAIWRKRHFI